MESEELLLISMAPMNMKLVLRMLNKRFGDAIGAEKRQRLTRLTMDMHMLRPVLDVQVNQLQKSGVGIMGTPGYVRLAQLFRPHILYMFAGVVEGFMSLNVMVNLRKLHAIFIPIKLTGGQTEVFNCIVLLIYIINIINSSTYGSVCFNGSVFSRY